MTRSTLAYPLTIDANGRLALSAGATIERDSIYSVIETRTGERVMRPLSYGTPDYVFDSIDNPLVVPKRLEVAIVDQIPGITECVADGEAADKGTLLVRIGWKSQEDEGAIAVRVG